MGWDREQEAHARLLVNSHLDKEKGGLIVRIKYYITPFIIMAVVVAMTIFKSPHAYDLACFVSPVILFLVWIGYAAFKMDQVKVSTEKGISAKFTTVFYLLVILLLAAYGHGWLAACWTFIWIATYLYRLLREEKLNEG